MITAADLGKMAKCLTSHNGFARNRQYKITEGMIFSAPENWEVAYRENKRECYINSLTYDINWYNKMISDGKYMHWVHGERKFMPQIIKELSEMITELRTIETDKTYKPWKESN